MGHSDKLAEKRLSRGGYRCRNCDTPFFADTVMDVTVDEWFAQMKKLHCPNCGASYHLLSLGLSLSLEEDVARRRPGTVDERAAEWIADGETGLSSLAIHAFMTGAAARQDAPRDVDDLRRCVLLIDRIPEWRDRMPEMSALAPWSALAPRWAEVERTYRDECPNLRGPTPRTSALLKQIDRNGG